MHLSAGFVVIQLIYAILCLQENDEENNVKLRRRPSHRRQSSVAISWSRFEDQSDRRRDSNASWARDEDIYDEVSTRTGRSRPNSWGPVGEFYYRESLCLSETDRSLFSHQECKLLDLICFFVVLRCLFSSHISSKSAYYVLYNFLIVFF